VDPRMALVYPAYLLIKLRLENTHCNGFQPFFYLSFLLFLPVIRAYPVPNSDTGAPLFMHGGATELRHFPRLPTPTSRDPGELSSPPDLGRNSQPHVFGGSHPRFRLVRVQLS